MIACWVTTTTTCNPPKCTRWRTWRRHLDGIGVENLGVEMDNYYFSAKAFSVLLQALPNVGFADATAMVNWQRAIKSEPEIAFMRKAALISEKVVDGLLERVEPGVPKNEVVAEIYRDAISRR